MSTPDTHTLIQQLRSYANRLGLGWIAEAADCMADQEKYRDLLDRQIDDLTNDFNGLCEINKSLSQRNESLEALCSNQANIEILRQEAFDWKSLCEKGDKAIESQAQRIAELEESRENTLNLLEASQGRIRRQEIEAHELHSENASLKDKVRELISQRDHFQSEATRLRGMCIDKANGMAELQSQLDEYREDPKNL